MNRGDRLRLYFLSLPDDEKEKVLKDQERLAKDMFGDFWQTLISQNLALLEALEIHQSAVEIKILNEDLVLREEARTRYNLDPKQKPEK